MSGKTRRLTESVLEHRGQVSYIFVTCENQAEATRRWVLGEVPSATMGDSGDVLLPDGRRVFVMLHNGEGPVATNAVEVGGAVSTAAELRERLRDGWTLAKGGDGLYRIGKEGRRQLVLALVARSVLEERA
jgi:hypothetical protein